jgi:hypothetical protein
MPASTAGIFYSFNSNFLAVKKAKVFEYSNICSAKFLVVLHQ